jgi:hypothetical protein
MSKDATDHAIADAVHDAAGLTSPKPDVSDPGEGLKANLPAFEGAQNALPKGQAAWAYERIIRYIRNFEQNLNADEEVVLGSAGSEAGILQIEGLGYFDPDLITFYGRDEAGMKTQLIQHVSQLSVMLRAVPKPRTQVPARRIGFRLNEGWMGGGAGDASV